MLSVATARVAGWSARIADYFDGPVVKELTFDCPICRERWVIVGHHDAATRVSALSVVYRPGGDIEARCASCMARWVGKVEVIHLGRMGGVLIDVDAIREALAPIPI